MKLFWEIFVEPIILVLAVVVLIPIVVYAPVVLKYIGIGLLACVVLGVAIGIYKLRHK